MTLRRLLDPRTIAVIGGTAAARAIAECDRLGFEGEIWPIHPTRAKVEGRSAFAGVADLPGAPDAAFVAVNRHAAIEVVRELAAMGTGGAVVHASGFAEAGEGGAALQQQLIAGHDMPLIGPNCYGTINAISGAAMWPDVHGCRRVERGPAFISQSGNIALNITMNNQGVDFSHVLSLGNQASVTIATCVEHFAADPAVTAIGIYLESVEDAVAFGRAALLAKECRIPIVVLKSGRSRTAQSISVTHTAAMSGQSDAYQALFDRYGIVTVESLPELITTLSMLGTIGPLPGRRIISLSCSGGEAAIVADRAVGHDLEFQPPTGDHRRRIKSTLSELVAITNPLDYHTFIWGDGERLEKCFSAVLDGPVDAAMLVLDWPVESLDDRDWWTTLDAFANAASHTAVQSIVVSTLDDGPPEKVRLHLRNRGLGAAPTIDRALVGLDACAAMGRWFEERSPEIHVGPGEPLTDLTTLTEPESKETLARAGIAIPRGVVVRAGDPPPDLIFPLVAKIVGAAHKTESGGVILGITDADALTTALERLHTLSADVLVEEMVTDGVVEVLVSIRREPSIGIVGTIAAGGTMTELLSDHSTVLLPTNQGDIETAVLTTRVGIVLNASPDLQSENISPIATTVDALDSIMTERPDIMEIEINPLIVTPTEAVAVDALIIQGTTQ